MRLAITYLWLITISGGHHVSAGIFDRGSVDTASVPLALSGLADSGRGGRGDLGDAPNWVLRNITRSAWWIS